MKNNKLISILLALLVCLSLVVSASATTGSDLAMTLESADSNVEALDAAVVGAGKTFTVSVEIATNTGFAAAVTTLGYDASVLEFVPAAEATKGVIVAAPAAGVLKVTVGDLNAAFKGEGENITSTGKVVDLTFKVLATEDKETVIELAVSNKNVITADGKFELSVSGDSLNVHTVAENHVCNAEEAIEANAKEATCTEDGKKADLVCAHCGKVLTEGEVIKATGHTWDEGVDKVAATCVDKGVKLYTCECGETKEEAVDALGHTEVAVPGKDATCTEAGLTEGKKCSVCGEVTVAQTDIAAKGHSYGEWEKSKGEEKRVCSVCNNVETRDASSSSVVIIIVIVVVVLAGAGVAAYFVLKNKKK